MWGLPEQCRCDSSVENYVFGVCNAKTCQGNLLALLYNYVKHTLTLSGFVQQSPQCGGM